MKTEVKKVSGWYRAFQNLVSEYSFEKLRVEGQIPQDIKGTLYRVGPGQFTLFGKRLPHWFDGDGAVAAIQIQDGEAQGAAKLIRTQGGQAEAEAGGHFLATYGMPAKSLLNRLSMKFRNVANTSILVWNKRLFALWEAGLPTELSPQDLSTVGETNLEGLARTTFSAHPRYVPSRKAYYNFGVEYGPRSKIHLMELSDSGESRSLGSIPFSGTAFVHDFIATENYLVFICAPIFVDLITLLVKGAPISDSMYWKDNKGTQVIVVPLHRPQAHWKIRTESFLPIHFFNGFETSDSIVMDSIAYTDMSTVEGLKAYSHGETPSVKPGKIIRNRIDLNTRTFHFEDIANHACDFPQVSPTVYAQEYQWGYALSHLQSTPDYFTSISKINMRTGQVQAHLFPEGHYPSEPAFVPKAGGQSEDEGYVLSLVYDSVKHESYVAVLDAQNFDAQPLAKIYLKGFFPLTFHGAWAAQ